MTRSFWTYERYRTMLVDHVVQPRAEARAARAAAAALKASAGASNASNIARSSQDKGGVADASDLLLEQEGEEGMAQVASSGLSSVDLTSSQMTATLHTPSSASPAKQGKIPSSVPTTLVVHPGWDLVAGSAAGATAVIFTYPLDLIRTRLAWSTEPSKAKNINQPAQAGAAPLQIKPQTGAHAGLEQPSIRSVMLHTVRQEGLQGLYRGCMPTLLGILPYAGE